MTKASGQAGVLACVGAEGWIHSVKMAWGNVQENGLDPLCKDDMGKRAGKWIRSPL